VLLLIQYSHWTGQLINFKYHWLQNLSIISSQAKSIECCSIACLLPLTTSFHPPLLIVCSFILHYHSTYFIYSSSQYDNHELPSHFLPLPLPSPIHLPFCLDKTPIFTFGCTSSMHSMFHSISSILHFYVNDLNFVSKMHSSFVELLCCVKSSLSFANSLLQFILSILY
jgi:hypothetical protein